MVGPQHVDDPVSSTFALLSHRQRRYALGCLREYESPMALADLADEVAVRECDAPITELSGETVKRVYLSLYHTHVPKLAAAGVVRYDQQRDEVTLVADDERLERLEGFLEGPDDERPTVLR